MAAKTIDDVLVEELMETGPVSRVLEVSPTSTINFVKRGVLPAIRTSSGTYLFKRSDVAAFLKRRRQLALVRRKAS